MKGSVHTANFLLNSLFPPLSCFPAWQPGVTQGEESHSDNCRFKELIMSPLMER